MDLPVNEKELMNMQKMSIMQISDSMRKVLLRHMLH